MDFTEIVLGNFQKDFKKLLPKTPGYLNCRIVAGYGNCQKGFISDDIEVVGIMLIRVDEFKFEMVRKVISDFRSSKTKNQLVLCIDLAIPSGVSYIYRFYEIEGENNNIFLRKQSRVGIP
jgi:hypothetical protein